MTTPLGSPPRVRGKGAAAPSPTSTARITPACAGKRSRGFGIAHILEDHPRVCGEKSAQARSQYASEGSPPRVRGKVTLLPCFFDLTGITPACAGKSEIPAHKHCIVKDHPRVCGEKMRSSSV